MTLKIGDTVALIDRAMRIAASFFTPKPAGRQQSRPTARDAHARSGLTLNPNDVPVEYSIEKHGMPRFSYEPFPDSDADPGEVVWTWVPYEDDPAQGKDRPVLVLARDDETVIIAQMTSQDHTSTSISREDHLGRVWMEMGSGDWDRQGRPSEVRIDRLLAVHKDAIRREGGKLDKTRFTRITDAIGSFHAR